MGLHAQTASDTNHSITLEPLINSSIDLTWRNYPYTALHYKTAKHIPCETFCFSAENQSTILKNQCMQE